jgi:hypothetical protein
MADMVEKMLERPIRLADQVAKIADEAQSSKQDCLEIKAKTEELAGMLRQALSSRSKLNERPTRRVIDDTKQVLEKALKLISKCSSNGIMKWIFTVKLPAAVFRTTSMQLENSISDVSWLLRLSASADDRDDWYLGVPPIVAKEPLLCRIWEQIAILQHVSSLEERSLATDSLVSLALDNDRADKLIIEEGGLSGLLKLVKEGSMEAQAAASAIGLLALLGRDSENVEHIVKAGVCYVFAEILREGHMKVQAMVAWAISELAWNHPKYCQNHFARHNTIRLLVSHLAFETIKGRELEEPAAKAQMKAMAAKALWQLSKGNHSICQDITESRGLLCFAILLEKGAGDVQFYSAMALMEITEVAEQEQCSSRRRFAFKPISSAAKAVVEQLLRIVEANSNSNSNSNLLVPCIKSLGNLARTFQASETRIIEPLVRLLDKRAAVVSVEAAIALNKFACTDNFLHDYHCKAIIDAGGAKHLVQLVYVGKQMVQLPALILLCYIALHVPHSKALAQEEVLAVLEWSSKQAHLVEEPSIKSLLPEAKGKLGALSVLRFKTMKIK